MPCGVRFRQRPVGCPYAIRACRGRHASDAEVEGFRGQHYGKPVETMRAYLEGMKKAHYTAPPPPETPKTVIAALGPKMLALAAEQADGAHPYNVTPEHTAQARKTLGLGKLLCPEQMILAESDPAKARAKARASVKIYLSLPNY